MIGAILYFATLIAGVALEVVFGLAGLLAAFAILIIGVILWPDKTDRKDEE